MFFSLINTLQPARIALVSIRLLLTHAMNFFLIFFGWIFCLGVFLTESRIICRGKVADPDCSDKYDPGNSFYKNCTKYTNLHMWWFNDMNLTCRQFKYEGCGGSKNRFCSLGECLECKFDKVEQKINNIIVYK